MTKPETQKDVLCPIDRGANVRSRERNVGRKEGMNGLKNYLDFDFIIKQKAKKKKCKEGSLINTTITVSK